MKNVNDERLPTSGAVRSNNCQVLAVVVLYKKNFEAVPSATRLLQWLDANAHSDSIPDGLILSSCLIYDNSPVAQPWHSDFPREKLLFVHDSSNGGTRAAYLYALKLAQSRHCDWILFLDHDTELPQNFLFEADLKLKEGSMDRDIVAVVPSVFDHGSQISPCYITAYGRVHRARDLVHQKALASISAIASGALVRCDALAVIVSITSIPAEFTLDYLDHWLFRELQRSGGEIAVSSARVEHSLSVLSLRTISAERYRAVLAAELVFLRSGKFYFRLAHLGWHLLRTLKITFKVRRWSLMTTCLRSAWTIGFKR